MSARRPRLRPEDVVVIVGKRKSGKSERAKQILREEMAVGARCLAFDLHDEYSVHGRKTKATSLGPLTERITIDDLVDQHSSTSEVPVAERPLNARRLALAVVPRVGAGGAGKKGQALAEDVEDLVSLVRTTGDLTLLFDEVGEYSRWANDELNSAATQSRHWGELGCPIIFVAQRGVQIPKSARDQASILYSGLQNDPEDLQTLRKITGSQEFADSVSRLPRPGLLEWRDEEGNRT